MNNLSEKEVRKLRDNIYGNEPKFRTDKGWEEVKKNWMKPENIQWLIDNQPKINKK